MARGSKAKYTAKQKREAKDIAEGYVERGYPQMVAEKIAWATVNKTTGGGKKSGSGRGKKVKKTTKKTRSKTKTTRAGRVIKRRSAKKKTGRTATRKTAGRKKIVRRKKTGARRKKK